MIPSASLLSASVSYPKTKDHDYYFSGFLHLLPLRQCRAPLASAILTLPVWRKPPPYESSSGDPSRLWWVADRGPMPFDYDQMLIATTPLTIAFKKQPVNLCLEITRPLLETLLYLGEDRIVLCVGNKDEIECMLLGTCMIRSHDWTTFIMSPIMNPTMMGWLKVWSCFVC